MDVKQAVATAKVFILDLYKDENPSNVGLEEVELNEADDEWAVTIGFSRPWDEPRNALAALAAPASIRRSYKIVRIANTTDEVLSVKNRELKN